MTAAGLWFLNGNDLYTTYGIVVESGKSGFLALPARKESLSYNWPEEDGTEIDLSEPHAEDYDVTLKVSLLATSKADFMDKRKLFFQELFKPGTQLLGVADYGNIYKVYYKNTSTPDLRTKRLNGVDTVVWSFNLTLGVQWELHPITFENSGFPYIFPYILK